ncbi:MAG TPA: hypothetical protein VGO47_15320 [Chlamydiales bacterium]|nr:hypothetical protein [Chlamydiales bacterium]
MSAHVCFVNFTSFYPLSLFGPLGEGVGLTLTDVSGLDKPGIELDSPEFIPICQYDGNSNPYCTPNTNCLLVSYCFWAQKSPIM